VNFSHCLNRDVKWQFRNSERHVKRNTDVTFHACETNDPQPQCTSKTVITTLREITSWSSTVVSKWSHYGWPISFTKSRLTKQSLSGCPSHLSSWLGLFLSQWTYYLVYGMNLISCANTSAISTPKISGIDVRENAFLSHRLRFKAHNVWFPFIKIGTWSMNVSIFTIKFSMERIKMRKRLLWHVLQPRRELWGLQENLCLTAIKMMNVRLFTKLFQGSH
jgi:hypothetical protein